MAVEISAPRVVEWIIDLIIFYRSNASGVAAFGVDDFSSAEEVSPADIAPFLHLSSQLSLVDTLLARCRASPLHILSAVAVGADTVLQQYFHDVTVAAASMDSLSTAPDALASLHSTLYPWFNSVDLLVDVLQSLLHGAPARSAKAPTAVAMDILHSVSMSSVGHMRCVAQTLLSTAQAFFATQLSLFAAHALVQSPQLPGACDPAIPHTQGYGINAASTTTLTRDKDSLVVAPHNAVGLPSTTAASADGSGSVCPSRYTATGDAASEWGGVYDDAAVSILIAPTASDLPRALPAELWTCLVEAGRYQKLLVAIAAARAEARQGSATAASFAQSLTTAPGGATLFAAALRGQRSSASASSSLAVGLDGGYLSLAGAVVQFHDAGSSLLHALAAPPLPPTDAVSRKEQVQRDWMCYAKPLLDGLTDFWLCNRGDVVGSFVYAVVAAGALNKEGTVRPAVIPAAWNAALSKHGMASHVGLVKASLPATRRSVFSVEFWGGVSLSFGDCIRKGSHVASLLLPPVQAIYKRCFNVFLLLSAARSVLVPALHNVGLCMRHLGASTSPVVDELITGLRIVHGFLQEISHNLLLHGLHRFDPHSIFVAGAANASSNPIAATTIHRTLHNSISGDLGHFFTNFYDESSPMHCETTPVDPSLDPLGSTLASYGATLEHFASLGFAGRTASQMSMLRSLKSVISCGFSLSQIAAALPRPPRVRRRWYLRQKADGSAGGADALGVLEAEVASSCRLEDIIQLRSSAAQHIAAIKTAVIEHCNMTLGTPLAPLARLWESSAPE